MARTTFVLLFALLSETSIHGFNNLNYHKYSKSVSGTSSNLLSFGLPRSTSLFVASSPENSNSHNSQRDVSDYYPLQPIKVSKERRDRIRNEKRNLKRFLQGNDLIESRNEVSKLQKTLKKAIRDLDAHKVRDLRQQISQEQKKDAEHVYQEALKNLEDTKLKGSEDISSFEEEVKYARDAIPHFQLEGMWVGKYGSHGYEMINVTYVGDTLVAYKVTGDKNVPKGEITFKAYLGSEDAPRLTPIELTKSASKQWGVKHLTRFPGEGQVAAEGFQNAQYMDGQLIIVGEYFSFAWVPIGHQIFFGRPSPELVLKLLRESRTATPNDDLNSMRDLATRCMDETKIIEEEECVLYHGSLGFEDTNLDQCFQ